MKEKSLLLTYIRIRTKAFVIFRDIGFILKKEGLSHGLATIDDNDNDNKKSSNDYYRRYIPSNDRYLV
jgi:hypothetical protein